MIRGESADFGPRGEAKPAELGFRARTAWWACGKHPQDCLQQCGSAIRTLGPRYADSMRRWRRLDSEVYGTWH